MPLGGGLSCSYNGFTFSERMETLSVNSRAQYDAAGRTIIFWRHLIRLKDTLIGSGGATTDTLLASAKSLLGVPGGELVYHNVGWGAFSINTASVRDVEWGPKPNILSYTPIGTKACEIVWEVEVALPGCSGALYGGALMEFCYELTTSRDRAGWTTRTYTGNYAVPQTRGAGSDDRHLGDSADEYWESVQPEIPPGFRLASSTHTLDASKCRCTFTIVHQELDSANVLPPGIISCDASHSIQSAEKSFTTWMGDITAAYELARDFPAEQVWGHFFQLARQRFARMVSSQDVAGTQAGQIGTPDAGNGAAGTNTGAIASNASTVQNPGVNTGAFIPSVTSWAIGALTGIGTTPDPGANTGGDTTASQTVLGMVIPTRLSATEASIYGRPQATFSIGYMFTQSIEKIAASCGLFMPTEGDYDSWKLSLQNGAFHPRGNAKLKFDPTTDDVILDLCLGADSVSLEAGQEDGAQTLTTNLAQALGLEMPSPEMSWIHYESRIEMEPAASVVEHKPLPVFQTELQIDAETEIDSEAFNSIQDPTIDGLFTTEPSNDAPASTVYRRTDNQQVVYLVGRAARAQYDIPPPVLKSFGDNEPIEACRAEMGEGFKTWVAANFGIPIICASWRIRYIIPTRPGQTIKAGAPPTPFVPRALTIDGESTLIRSDFGG